MGFLYFRYKMIDKDYKGQWGYHAFLPGRFENFNLRRYYRHSAGDPTLKQHNSSSDWTIRPSFFYIDALRLFLSYTAAPFHYKTLSPAV